MRALWILFLALAIGIPAFTQAASEPLAEVDGVAITAEEVEKPLAPQVSKLEEQIYNLKRQRLDTLINDKLLAKESAKRKLTVPALLDAEVTAKVGLVTEQEIEKFYQDNKAQIKGEQAELREKIRAFLQNQKLTAKREEFLASLRSQAKIVVNLKPPPIQRVDVSVQGAVQGRREGAGNYRRVLRLSLSICRQVIPTSQNRVALRRKIKLISVISIENLHPGATKAHEAARCATEQGKFWPYHDKLFASAPSSSPRSLRGWPRKWAK